MQALKTQSGMTRYDEAIQDPNLNAFAVLEFLDPYTPRRLSHPATTDGFFVVYKVNCQQALEHNF